MEMSHSRGLFKMPLEVQVIKLFCPCYSAHAPIFHQTLLAELTVKDEITKNFKAEVA